MRRTSATSEREWPSFPLGPILIEYGGEDVMEDRGWYPYKCPFHGDSTASASINTILHVFVCHTCEMKGNAVQLIMKKENIPYGPALRRAEEIAGASTEHVPGTPGRSSGVSRRSGNRQGSRALKRTWRSS